METNINSSAAKATIYPVNELETAICPYCGALFRMRRVNGYDLAPPCRDCTLDGERPMTDEDRLKQNLE